MKPTNAELLEKWKQEYQEKKEKAKAKLLIQTTACKALREWIENAVPGQEFKYYTGIHIVGLEIGMVARMAYENKRITLFQRRCKEGNGFEYWARKRDE